MSLLLAENEVNALINRGHFPQAVEKIDAIERNSGSDIEKRLSAYLRSQVLLRTQNYDEAIRVLISARQKYGTHITLLTNLSTSYYLSGRFLEFKSVLTQACEAFDANQNGFCRQRRLGSGTTLAQLLEEQGEVSQSLKLYQKVLSECDPVSDAKHYYKTLVQILRLCSAIGMRTRIEQFYPLLTRMGETHPNEYLAVEVQHALMLAEGFLFGVDFARQRRDRLLQTRLSSYDRRLVVFDFEELSFFATRRFAGDFGEQKRGLATGTLDAYERLMEDVILAKVSPSSLLGIGELPLARQLVISKIISLGATLPDLQAQAAKLHQFLLDQLNADDRRVWLRKFEGSSAPAHSPTETVRELRVDFESFSILDSHRNSFCLRKQRQVWRLISHLIRQGETDEHRILVQLWGMSAASNPSYSHRLRNLTYRANELARKALGVDQLIDWNKSKKKLRFDSGIRIQG